MPIVTKAKVFRARYPHDEWIAACLADPEVTLIAKPGSDFDIKPKSLVRLLHDAANRAGLSVRTKVEANGDVAFQFYKEDADD